MIQNHFSQYNPVISILNPLFTKSILRQVIPSSHKWHLKVLNSKNHDNLQLTPFPKRFPWRVKRQRMDWPSNGFPSEPFCNPYRPIFGRVCVSSVFLRFWYHGVYLKLYKKLVLAQVTGNAEQIQLVERQNFKICAENLCI